MAGKRKSEDGAGSVAGKKRPAQEAEPEAKPAFKRTEEEDFPRGGASTLTPAEIREAREEADAEFEKEKGKKSGKKRGEGKKGKRDAGEDDGFHGSILSGKLQKSAEFLRYKSLVVGMKIWGAVAEINKKDMVISLPGGLRGFVSAEDASEVFESTKGQSNKAKKQKKSGKKAENNDTDAVDLDKEVPHLSDLFSLGQLVACTVRKLELVQEKKGRAKTEKEGKNEKKGRRIELSLRLNYLYDGLSIEAVHEGQALSAVVTSIEDHGYLLSFGIPAISGFLLRSNYMDGKESAKLRKGQLVQGVVISVDKKRGAVGLKANPGLVASNMVKEFVGLTVELLTPGVMVNARVRAVLKNGLLLSFLTYFTGTVDIFHLEDPLPGADWSKKYSENQRLKARILYIDPVAKTVGLTLNPQLINNVAPAMAVDVGNVFKDAIVRRVDATVGMLLELPTKESQAAGYVHISNVSDEHIAKLEKKYTEGKKVRARVIGHRAMDALAIVSLKESVVEQLLLSHADVKPAMNVSGTVVSVEPYGALVQLAEGVKALCPLQHMSEFQRSIPSTKFQVGAKLKFRVLTCDHETKKIVLTHKKTMISSKLNPLVSYEDAVEGLVTHGFITGVEDIGCFVTFYNDVKGLVHKSALGIEAGVKAETVFQLGQSVKCRVLRSDPSARRLSLSFITTPRDSASEGDADDVKPGKIVAGTVAHVSDSVVILDISTAKGSIKGYMTFPHLSDNLGHIDQLKAVMKVGVQFDQLLILEVTDKQKLIVSAKHSMLQAASSLPSDISQLLPQSVIPGFIANITDRGCFVRFLGRLTGLASIPQVADEFVSDPNNHFKIGQSVRAQVLEVHHDTGKFSLCLKQSVCFSTDASLIHGYFLEEEKIVDSSGASNLEWTESLAIGTCTAGEVQEIKDYGVIIKIPSYNDIVGFVTHYQLGDPVEVGKSVQARVLDVVKADGIVDLTLRPELLEVGKQETTKSKKEKNKKRANPATTLELHQKVAAVVELVKDTYLVLSLPEQGNAIGFAAAGDYNSQQQDSHQRYKPGQRVVATAENLGDKASGQRLLLLLSKPDDAPQTTPRSAKKSRKESKKEIGTVVDAEVVAIEKLQLIVRVGTTVEGRVHITEIMDQFEKGNPLSHFKVGQMVKGRVVQKVRAVKTPGSSEQIHVLELSLRPSQLPDTLEAGAGRALPGALPSIKEITTGQVVKAYVQEVKNDWAWLLVAPHLRGRLFLLDSSSDPSELGKFTERFPIGTAVSCRVKAIDHEKQTLDFTLRDSLQQEKKTEFHVPPMGGEGENDQKQDVAFQKGDILGGRVARVNPGVGGLSIQIAPAVFGRVHVTHLSDSWKDDPVAGFKEGQFVRCVVLEVGKSATGKTQIDLTLRKSLGGLAAANLREGDTDTDGSSKVVNMYSIKDLKKDLEVQGFVKSATSKGCFVTLAPNVDARVLISNLSNSFVKEPAESFPPGKLVTGRILSVEPLSGRVEMSLKGPSEKKKPTSNILGRRFGDFKEGEVVFGTIKRIEKFGMFVTVEQSSVVGMCHVSEIADHYVKDIDKHYKVGDRVRARVVKIDTANERISLGLKESYFPETEKLVEPVSEEDGMEITNEQETNVTFVDDAEESQEDDEDDEDDENEDEEKLVELQGAQSDDEESEDESEEENGIDLDDLDEDDEEENDSEDDIPETGAATLVAPPLEVELEEESRPGNDSEEEEEDEESEDAKKLTKRAKKRLKEQREAEITAAEEKRLKGDQAPETVDEFEALVRTSPNSSLVWIKYMAFLVQLADVDKARAIAERALQTINYREEGEKMNVWIAYLNLENVYGNPPKEAVLTLFNRALQYNDPKKLYFALLGIYENPRQPQGPQHDMVDQLLKTMTRKFNTSAKVWLRQIQSLLARDMGDAAHKALDQSLLSLPRRKHIKVISRAALLEFKTGSVERARSIFEGILRNYPKRVDLWSVYLDQEIRVGEVPVIRALFERVICLELPPRKMKFLFKKYLDYEKAHGDEERIEHVKRKAMEYVDTKLG
ncbi:hypothetical protein M758_1G025900 [Ceratodon purpureus]|nr:hypothetical protein M758_1G025900 [Ceratodon purpureus]